MQRRSERGIGRPATRQRKKEKKKIKIYPSSLLVIVCYSRSVLATWSSTGFLLILTLITAMVLLLSGCDGIGCVKYTWRRKSSRRRVVSVGEHLQSKAIGCATFPAECQDPEQGVTTGTGHDHDTVEREDSAAARALRQAVGIGGIGG